ncbi:ABC1 kinase family protein [Sporichthya sp.]|uniref:ABC1 kinase family protein n=1 Tax=Sporichthya sp. TaxID=65475 RepID=UPI00184597A1|nr:AarF/ABC1/UbiB kinase family protein [Sporichthya sp.]
MAHVNDAPRGPADIPIRAVTRGAKLAALPLGMAGRATLGLGKRIGGKPAEMVTAEIQARTAEQIFKTLGELKGGAMKFGQALSVFEAALPEAVVAPYRAALVKLQEAAPPLPARVVTEVMQKNLGPAWRELFTEFDTKAVAAASIGQVHRAMWSDGRDVAVKIQYPGAGEALLGDLNQISRLARLFGSLVPGLDIKALMVELKARVAEELDYALEADSQRAFAAAFAGDPDFCVPQVVHQSGNVIVTEWIDGTPLSKVITDGDQETRNRAGVLYHRFHMSSPTRVGKLHADPHPGNFRMLADGRLGVLDFGAVNHLPEGIPPAIGVLLGQALRGEAQAVVDGLRAEGFLKPSINLDADKALAYLLPFLEPITAVDFQFSRAWLRAQGQRIGDPRSPNYSTGLQFNLPPRYLLLHRVWLGSIGVLCQLEAAGPWRQELADWLPGAKSLLNLPFEPPTP